MFESEKKEHLTKEEHDLLGDAIKGQLRVIHKLQNHILIGNTSGNSPHTDDCNRITTLVNSLGYLIAFRSGSNIDWAIGKAQEEEIEEKSQHL